jgi:predicted DNA-binding transcriptional regulator AlpA
LLLTISFLLDFFGLGSLSPRPEIAAVLFRKTAAIILQLFHERKIMTIKNTLTKNLPNENTEPLLDRKAAARYLNVSPGTLAVWDCTKRYNLHPVKVGRRSVRYRRSALDQFLADQLHAE